MLPSGLLHFLTGTFLTEIIFVRGQKDSKMRKINKYTNRGGEPKQILLIRTSFKTDSDVNQMLVITLGLLKQSKLQKRKLMG